jgi:Mg/Co/Ni transporter MgtE
MFRDHERVLKNTFEKKAIYGFGWAAILLQAADAVSTYLALATGKAQENNFLLVGLAETSGATINSVVLISKIVLACLFFVAMRKTKPTRPVLAALIGVAAFYLLIVAQNISLAINLT